MWPGNAKGPKGPKPSLSRIRRRRRRRRRLQRSSRSNAKCCAPFARDSPESECPSQKSLAPVLLPVLLRKTAALWPRHLRLQPHPAAAAHPRLCQQRVSHPLLSRITTASWARPCAFPSCTTSKSPPRSCWLRPRCTLHAAVRLQAPRPSTPRHPSAACKSSFGQRSARASCSGLRSKRVTERQPRLPARTCTSGRLRVGALAYCSA